MKISTVIKPLGENNYLIYLSDNDPNEQYIYPFLVLSSRQLTIGPIANRMLNYLQ